MSTFFLITLKLNKSFTEILIKLPIRFWGNSIIKFTCPFHFDFFFKFQTYGKSTQKYF